MSWRRPSRRALLAFLALAAVLAFAACQNGSDPPRATGLWFAFPDSVYGREGPIRLVHVDSGFEDDVGPPGVYRNVAWAPGGKRLAAVRMLPDPELVVFDLEGDEGESFAAPLDLDDVQISWSPDANRLLVLSATGILVFDPELDLLGQVMPPEEAPGPPGYSPGMWSDDSALFAAYLHGYLFVIDRVGRSRIHDPAAFVRNPGETRSITIMSWEGPRALAVFEETEAGGPRRYVLSVGGDELEVLSSSDFDAEAGPFDGLLRQASEAAGGSQVVMGLNSAPTNVRWVVAHPGPGDVPVRVFVRQRDIFLAAGSGLFGTVDPAELARDLSVMVVPPAQQ